MATTTLTSDLSNPTTATPPPTDYSDISQGSTWLENWFQNNPGVMPPLDHTSYTSNKGFTNLSNFYNLNRMGNHLTLENLENKDEAIDNNAEFWTPRDAGGWVRTTDVKTMIDPLTGITAQVRQVETKGGSGRFSFSCISNMSSDQ